MDAGRKHQLKKDYLAAQRTIRRAQEQADCGLALLRVMSPAVDNACRRMDEIEAEVKAELEAGTK